MNMGMLQKKKKRIALDRSGPEKKETSVVHTNAA